MWQVVSGTANLLSVCDVQAVVRKVAASQATHALVKSRQFRIGGHPPVSRLINLSGRYTQPLDRAADAVRSPVKTGAVGGVRRRAER